jgi:hypothetical protein
MDHRTVFGEYHCGTHIYRGSDMAEVEGVTRKANLKQAKQPGRGAGTKITRSQWGMRIRSSRLLAPAGLAGGRALTHPGDAAGVGRKRGTVGL